MGANEPDNAAKLAEVADRASVCTRCDLSATRNKVVFGEGNPSAPLVFVGEGPGQNEDATGRPFVGRAGELLDACMREHGITRKHVYICNVIKCRACVAQGGRLINRPPRVDESQACAAWLDEQLSVIKPFVIVCLGGPAASSLIHPNFRMLQERGQWFDTSRYCRYITAALHPAFVLRQEGQEYEAARRQLVQDIGAARLKVIEAKKEPPRTLF